MQDNLHRLRHAYLNGQGLVCLLAMPIGFGFAVVAGDLVELAMGRRWLPAVPVIQVLAILSALQVSESSQPLAMALDRTKEVFQRDIRVFVIRIPIVLAGLVAGTATDLGALMGMVVGRAISSLINIGLNIRLVAILSGISVATQLSVVFRPLIAAGAMSAALLLIIDRFELFFGMDEPYMKIGLAVGIGAILYPALLTLVWFAAGRPDGAERALMALLNRALRSLSERVRS